jgi:hypothetical protein
MWAVEVGAHAVRERSERDGAGRAGAGVVWRLCARCFWGLLGCHEAATARPRRGDRELCVYLILQQEKCFGGLARVNLKRTVHEGGWATQ